MNSYIYKHIYIYIYTHINLSLSLSVYTYIYIYIYRERERDYVAVVLGWVFDVVCCHTHHTSELRAKKRNTGTDMQCQY